MRISPRGTDLLQVFNLLHKEMEMKDSISNFTKRNENYAAHLLASVDSSIRQTRVDGKLMHNRRALPRQ